MSKNLEKQIKLKLYKTKDDQWDIKDRIEITVHFK